MDFTGLKQNHYGAILADPPWKFETWSELGQDRAPDYPTLSVEEIAALPVKQLALRDCVLFLWVTWPLLHQGLYVIDRWKFTYKTCAFAWVKADPSQMDLWGDLSPHIGTGYWTRANSEVCLLATRGKPKRIHADVRQAIIEPAREHSRKPEPIYQRIERLIAGPYVELFARQKRDNWHSWGNEVDKF